MKSKQYLKKRRTRKTKKNRKTKKGGSGRGTRKSSSAQTFQSIERYNKLTNQLKDQIKNNDTNIKKIISTSKEVGRVYKNKTSNDKRILEKITNDLIKIACDLCDDNEKLKHSLRTKSYLKGKSICL